MSRRQASDRVDHRRGSRALLGAGRRMVGPARQDGGAAQVQSGAARLHPRRGVQALRARSQTARLPEGPAHPRHRLRRRDSVASRWRGSARTCIGADPAETNIAAAKLHAEQCGPRDRLSRTTAEALADAGERFDIVLAMEVVEHVADVKLFVETLRRDGAARRADDRRHASTAR